MHAVQRVLSVEGMERLSKLNANISALPQGRVGTDTKYSVFLLPQMPEGKHFLCQKTLWIYFELLDNTGCKTYRN